MWVNYGSWSATSVYWAAPGHFLRNFHNFQAKNRNWSIEDHHDWGGGTASDENVQVEEAWELIPRHINHALQHPCLRLLASFP